MPGGNANGTGPGGMEGKLCMADNIFARKLDANAHVVIITRWREQYAHYARYLDHSSHRVTYITNEIGSESVPAGAADAVVVRATDDLESVRGAMRELVGRHGRPAAVVSLKEDDLLVGASLREEWNCPGQRRDELILFRDKYRMCQAVAAAGLPVPAFAPLTGAESVRAFAATAGWPVIIKPRIGSSSEGVAVLNGPADAAGLVPADEPMLVQAYNSNPIYHVDGIFTGVGLAQWRASRYINTCLGFRGGSFLGSVEEDAPEINRAIGRDAARFLAALTSQPTPFHLEVFVDVTAPGGPSCTFLEVGARVGGAEIPFIWRDLHGYDLMSAAFRLQLGLPAEAPKPSPSDDKVGGWLLVPSPMAPPCRITEVTPMLGRVPGPYAEALLRPGDVLPLADAYYEHVGGRFRFRGRSSAEVEAALLATARDFRVRAQRISLSGADIPRVQVRIAGGGTAQLRRAHPVTAKATKATNGARKLVAKDYSQPVLSGAGDSDYARYMRTDTLLSLQRTPAEVIHRDELLFQTIHQSTELWLKLACAEVLEAAAQMRAGAIDASSRLLGRAALSMELITDQLEMLRHLAPWDFQTIRTILGHGSGFESPGWFSAQRVSGELRRAFDQLVAERGIDLVELYQGSCDHPVYRLAEAMIEWDERISIWRVRHYKIATRVIGHQVVGTKGTPVDVLAKLISHKFFPELWRVRTELTDTGPMSELARAGQA
jgi:tryptophan 2,3-dioxygenase